MDQLAAKCPEYLYLQLCVDNSYLQDFTNIYASVFFLFSSQSMKVFRVCQVKCRFRNMWFFVVLHL